MEGPTPVSALIHAATMVTAGVYMVSRMNLLFTLSGVAGQGGGILGAVAALCGALDMRKRGGLRKYLPLTYPTFLVGAIAIAGVPFLSGFFSKDAILTQAFAQGQYFIWAFGLLGAVLTAFYMFRLVFLSFFCQERIHTHAKEHLHESPRVMTFPLVMLALFSVGAGS